MQCLRCTTFWLLRTRQLPKEFDEVPAVQSVWYPMPAAQSLGCPYFVTNKIVDGNWVINNRYYNFLLYKYTATIETILLPFPTLLHALPLLLPSKLFYIIPSRTILKLFYSILTHILLRIITIIETVPMLKYLLPYAILKITCGYIVIYFLNIRRVVHM